MKQRFPIALLVACLSAPASPALPAQPEAPPPLQAQAEIPVLIQSEPDADGKPLPPQPTIPAMVRMLASESGLRLAIRPLPWRRAQMLAENGEGLLFGAAVTPDRLAKFSFTRPLDSANQWLVSTAPAPLAFHEWEDLRGKVISIMSGGRFGADFERQRGQLFTVEQNATTLANRIAMLRARRVDAVMVASYLDAPRLEAKLNCLFPDRVRLVIAGKPVDSEPIMIAVPKASPLHASFPVLDAAVARLARANAFAPLHAPILPC